MSYDGLDRLTTVVSPMYGATGAAYGYDSLDNLTRVVLSDRNHYYCYDGSNRLTNVKTGGCSSGATVIGLGYDVQGNLANKNGTLYTFDLGNRLRTVGPSPASSYVYDGQGRRVRDTVAVSSKYSQYTLSGQLAMTGDERAGTVDEYVYLAGSLLAIRERDTATNTYTVRYQHTDALGSPVVVTNGSRVALEPTREYEPYGRQLTPTPKDGPGYTGHVYDVATGLNYMQQRYYDPLIGKFLSTDAVSVDSVTGRNFCRYCYATNNPYRFIDPDGRQSAPFPVWPVPGHYQLNHADKPREGEGAFGTPRNTASGPSTHTGIDIQAPVGSAVVAADGGTVVNQQPNPSKTYGNQVVINHGDGVYTQSAHLNSVSVKPGDTVTAGQEIGTIGTTGNTPKQGDSHLHFEVRIDGPAPRVAGGTVVDPMKYLPPPPPPETSRPPSPPPIQ
ncbi:peptidoglycan DD-metalloendopeptidase family protein [Cognatiluteimonas weifangensis]|uniref:peptidoglycan DD-metalloendopeptidase family protein n=1 Tax=Cognatiluteimonas weifangensis TaxID=2303539 RepID=UPI001314B20F|nr:peptidoglycan DD-metalloendopeptidase family protein [Luteimonas weifangensis]